MDILPDRPGRPRTARYTGALWVSGAMGCLGLLPLTLAPRAIAAPPIYLLRQRMSVLAVVAMGAPLTGPATVLQTRFKAGDTSKYQVSVQMTLEFPVPGQPAPMATGSNINLVEQRHVVKELPGGGGEVAVTILSSQGTVNGQPLAAIPNKPFTVDYDAGGNVRSIVNAPASMGGGGLFDRLFRSDALKLLDGFLPPKAVRRGETWTQTVRMPGLDGGPGTAKTQYVRDGAVGRFHTAILHTTVSIPIRIMLDVNLQPTTQANRAASSMTGLLNISIDTDFAATEGKLVRSAGTGGATLTFLSKTHPQPHTGAKPATAAPASKITLRLSSGSNLME